MPITTTIYDTVEYNGNLYYLFNQTDYKDNIKNIHDIFYDTEIKSKEEWIAWIIDENGDYLEVYYDDEYGIEEVKYMVGDPQIGMMWDATGDEDVIEIVDKIDIINEFGVYTDYYIL